MDKKDDCISMVVSNLALVQCQGIVVGFVASNVAVIMDIMKGGELNLDHTLLLCASAVVTASIGKGNKNVFSNHQMTLRSIL